MGVDFYSCDECDEIYDDCGGTYDNCEEWGKMICFWCQADMGMRTAATYWSKGAKPIGDYWTDGSWTDDKGAYHEYYNLTSCPHCKNEIIDDERVLEYLLNKYELTKEKVIEEIKKST